MRKKKFQFIKKDIYKNKKALIFGKNSDLGNFAALYLKSLGLKLIILTIISTKKILKILEFSEIIINLIIHISFILYQEK